MRNRIPGLSLPFPTGAAVPAILTGLAFALAVSCDGDSPPGASEVSPTATLVAATPTPDVAQAWRIDFERTGGIAGLSYRLSLGSDGQATFEDVRAQRSVAATLDASVLAELRALIDSAGFFSQAASQGPPCPDCFNLSITVTVDARMHTVQGGDISLDEALMPLADRLAALLEDGLAP